MLFLCVVLMCLVMCLLCFCVRVLCCVYRSCLFCVVNLLCVGVLGCFLLFVVVLGVLIC